MSLNLCYPIASEALTEKFGKGYSVATIKSFRKFYLTFKNLQVLNSVSESFRNALAPKGQPMIALFKNLEKGQPMPAQLSWMHYENLMHAPSRVILEPRSGDGIYAEKFAGNDIS